MFGVNALNGWGFVLNDKIIEVKVLHFLRLRVQATHWKHNDVKKNWWILAATVD